MNIGVCIRFTDMEGMSKKFKDLVDNGFNSCQLVCWDMTLLTEENANTIKGLCKEYGVTVSAVWCGWEGPCVWNFIEGPTTLGLLPEEWREKRVKNLCLGSDFAEMLGVSDLVTHMGFIPENPNDPQFIPFCKAVAEVARYCKAKGQYLLFETGQETPVTMLRCFEEVGEDNLGVNLDTANLILYGKANPVDALDVFGKYVKGLHAKDGRYPTEGRELGRETRLGDGKVDFTALFSKLYELGYNGYVTIEREISGPKQTEDILFAKSYLENIISKIYGGSNNA
ncbi:MAG: sugar phosphate isomerase/epimerase [Clostridia bacterium]|nr:sugar phosphate isomerase/epimerase [Clostridia bacterium]